MTISPSLPLDLRSPGTGWPDEVVDLTDRRRLLVHALLGLDLPADVLDEVFARPQSSSSTTMRSGGRSSSTDDR